MSFDIEQGYILPPKKKSSFITLLHTGALIFALLTIGVPIIGIIVANTSETTIAIFFGALASVFALSGITLVGSIASFLIALVATLLEITHLSQTKQSLTKILKTPSPYILLAIVALFLYLFLL